MLEVQNPNFHVLILWQPESNVLAGTGHYLARTLGVELDCVMEACYQENVDVSLALRRALDEFVECIYDKLMASISHRPRVFAVLPRATVGARCPDGHLLIDNFLKPGFDVTFILLPF